MSNLVQCVSQMELEKERRKLECEGKWEKRGGKLIDTDWEREWEWTKERVHIINITYK